MFGALKPNLESVPGFEVRSSFIYFFCQCCHDGTGLILCICDSKGEQASLILRVELDGGGRDNQPGRSFSLDEAWLNALQGLLYSLVADTPLGEQRAHQVSGELPTHPRCLVDDQEAVLDRLLRVGQGAFAHGRESVVGVLWKKAAHSLDEITLAPGRWTFEGDADRLLKQARCEGQVQQLRYLRFSSYARA